MKIAEIYSHLNGLEYLKVHKKSLLDEIFNVIKKLNADKCLTKKSKEKTMMDKMLYSPKDLNKSFVMLFKNKGWEQKKISYWVTRDEKLIRKTLRMSPAEQKAAIEAEGRQPIFSYNQTDFVKERVAVEIQFGKYAFVAYDLFVKHLAFYFGDTIDVGIEVLPMKSMQSCMSSGVSYYEGELYNIIRHGRNVPAMPLVVIGIEP
jgi:hypothetical protein